MRMQVVAGAAGGLVINDAYNANPTSMAAALDALAAVDADRRVAVLGLMAELDDPVPAHRGDRRPGRASSGIELVAVGTDRYGVDAGRRRRRRARGSAPIGPGVAVLVKASRAVGLERVAAELAGR